MLEAAKNIQAGSNIAETSTTSFFEIQELVTTGHDASCALNERAQSAALGANLVYNVLENHL